MRPSVTVGLFLRLGGFMIVTLHPVYETGHAVATTVEATGPLARTTPIPPWFGLSTMAAGAVLLSAAWRRRRRR